MIKGMHVFEMIPQKTTATPLPLIQLSSFLADSLLANTDDFAGLLRESQKDRSEIFP
jgi:hypothetical protein